MRGTSKADGGVSCTGVDLRKEREPLSCSNTVLSASNKERLLNVDFVSPIGLKPAFFFELFDGLVDARSLSVWEWFLDSDSLTISMSSTSDNSFAPATGRDGGGMSPLPEEAGFSPKDEIRG